MIDKTNLLCGTVTAAIYLLSITVFVSRLADQPKLEKWIGIVLMLTAIPLIYLLIKPPQLKNSKLYYVQLSLMLTYLVVLLLTDYVFKYDFRSVKWMTICYVIFYFAATGGMLGVAVYAGRVWTITTVALFVVMFVLAFVQRAITGK